MSGRVQTTQFALRGMRSFRYGPRGNHVPQGKTLIFTHRYLTIISMSIYFIHKKYIQLFLYRILTVKLVIQSVLKDVETLSVKMKMFQARD